MLVNEYELIEKIGEDGFSQLFKASKKGFKSYFIIEKIIKHYENNKLTEERRI